MTIARHCHLLPAALATVLLAGCVHYAPLPLPTAADLKPTPQVTVLASQFQLPGLPPHPLPAAGMDETTLVTLAVLRDPDLEAARQLAGVAQAQLFAAGLLPDPVLGATIARSALATGYSLNLLQSLQALRLRGAAQASARASLRQVNLNILWQEWQVAERARELFIEARADARLAVVLARSRTLLAAAYRRDHAAVLRNNALASTAAADLAALTAAEASQRQEQLDASTTRHQLGELLALTPGTRLHLTGPTRWPPFPAARYRAAIAALPRRRPDLMALQAGYESQEQNLREAILAQFPALAVNAGPTRDPIEARSSIGLGFSLTLPLFNRNRGGIAVQTATRAVLRATYQARWDQAQGDAGQAWAAARILQRQLDQLATRVPALQAAARAGADGFRQGNVSAALYVTLESSSLEAQLQAIRLRAALATDESSLRTLLGLPFRPPG